MNIPALHLTDGYKVDHRRQYPDNTVKVYSNFTPRKSRVDGIDSIVFFGLTYFIKDVVIKEFNDTFFKLDLETAIKKYKRRLDNYLGKDNGITYEHVEALHKVGYLPVLIKALPEGALVKTNVPVLTITNELPEFFWVPNFLETILSCELWPGCTSLTMAFNYRLIFDHYALLTVGNTDFSSKFQIHDFSMRGMFGRHAAFLSGAAHLCASVGTDTIGAIDFLEEFYNADSDKELVGASVPATEHSVMCMGMQLGELETFKRLITNIYPHGIVAIVSDTWNLWDVVRPGDGIVATLKPEILAREGTLTIRPDSGDPVKILTGWNDDELFYHQGKFYHLEAKDVDNTGQRVAVKPGYQPMSEEERKGVVECLWEIFGGTITEKGYKLLDSHIRTIYGDSINLERATLICERLKVKGFASINWIAGVGSYTYQYVTRDTFGFAMKATYGEVMVRDWEAEAASQVEVCRYKLEPREIFKDPFTDRDPRTGLSVKKSAKGLLRVDELEDGTYQLVDQVTEEQEALGALEIVYKEGKLVRDTSLAEIRTLVDSNVKKLLNVA